MFRGPGLTPESVRRPSACSRWRYGVSSTMLSARLCPDHQVRAYTPSRERTYCLTLSLNPPTDIHLPKQFRGSERLDSLESASSEQKE